MQCMHTSILVNSKFEILEIESNGHLTIEMPPLGGTCPPSSSACPQAAYWCTLGTLHFFATVQGGAGPIR